jgi:hypothetical protein
MYDQYIVKCKNLYCQAYLRLPSDQLFYEAMFDQPTYEIPDEVIWPSDDWRARIACTRCGHVREYEEIDVIPVETKNREPQPKCLSVEMGCAKPDCKVAFRLFIAPVDDRHSYSRPSAEDIDLDGDIVALLRDGRFTGKCPNGHELGTLPKQLYKVTPFFGTIPSEYQNLHWAQHSSRLIGVDVGTRLRRTRPAQQ